MAKKGRLPKRIAGVKVPKKLRKRGGDVYALLQNPMVRNVVADMVAAGLIAAADAISKTPEVRKAGKKAKRAAGDTAEAASDAARTGAGNVGNVLAFAARQAAKAIKSAS